VAGPQSAYGSRSVRFRSAKANDPTTWATFDACIATRGFSGIGFELAPPYIGIDLDRCRSLTIRVSNYGQRIIDRLASYTEVSPSGKGIHIIIRGVLPPGRRRTSSIEMYSAGRYFTMTGNHIPGTPLTIEDRTAEVAILHAELFPDDEHWAIEGNHYAVLGDDEVLKRARTASNGSRFEALWRGDWESLGYPSQSEADFAFCCMLRFWGCDASRIDGLFRQSGLMRPKWEREYYRNRTISQAVRAKRTTPASRGYSL
jgi:putative DNA primase/helicase